MLITVTKIADLAYTPNLTVTFQHNDISVSADLFDEDYNSSICANFTEFFCGIGLNFIFSVHCGYKLNWLLSPYDTCNNYDVKYCGNVHKFDFYKLHTDAKPLMFTSSDTAVYIASCITNRINTVVEYFNMKYPQINETSTIVLDITHSNTFNYSIS